MSTHAGTSLAAVALLANGASATNGKDVAEKLYDDGNGRVAADYLAVVVSVDVADAAGGRAAAAAVGGRGNGNGSKGDGGDGELHVESLTSR